MTPSAEPKRFDARFFLAAAPSDQVAHHDAAETVDIAVGHAGRACSALRARRAQAAAAHHLQPRGPAPHATVESALEWARGRGRHRHPAQADVPGDTLAIVLPWDSEYRTLPGEGIPIDPASPGRARAPSRFVLAEGRWWGAA